MTPKHTSIAGFALILALVACNLPENEQDLSPGDVQTAAALTVQAALTIPVKETPTEPQSTIAVTLSPTVTAAPTGTITPTYSVPMLTVREQTNCRTGPGQDYEIVFTYLAGKKLEIAGRYDPDNYWLVKSAESPGGVCWLWGEFVDVTGSYWVVSSVTPPPTSTTAPPQAPSVKEWNFSCNLGTMTFTVDWTDKASNETGYRVYRDGDLLVELPPNSNTYTDSITLLAGESTEYYVQVYSPSGSANSPIMKMSC